MDTKETIGVFFDEQMLERVLEGLSKIRNNPTLHTDEERDDQMNEYFDRLSDEEKRELQNYWSYIQDINIEDGLCHPQMSDKHVLFEFANEQYNYCQHYAFFGMISYMLDRFEQYEKTESGEKVSAVQEFLESIFGGSSSKYIGTIYDMYYKNYKRESNAEIPEIDPDVFGPLMPSPEQCQNYIRYMSNHTEELRAFTTAMIGAKPSQEASMRFHGIFDGPTDPNFVAYRDQNTEKFNRQMNLVLCKFGGLYLLDSFKDFRGSITLFNGKNKNVEMLHTNRAVQNRADYFQFKGRLNSLEGRMSTEESKQYKQYHQDLLEEEYNANSTQMEKLDKTTSLREKIKHIQEALVDADTELITSVTKIGAGKKAKKKMMAYKV